MGLHTYFLGANTPEGFSSRYEGLFRDDRIKQVLILKGGPGCGKSTLMRRVGKAALDLGCETEEILCSSDPDSLDGLVIPAAGLALVDGTAPHILEPPLCGCGAEYFDLGSCYDSEKLLERKDALFSVKAKNAACYPLATTCFSAATAAQKALQVIAMPEDIDAFTVALSCKQKKARTKGRKAYRFYAALSPKGAILCELPCQTVWTLKDNYGAAPQILSEVADSFTAAGCDVIIGSLPLFPMLISLVMIPELSTAYATVTEEFVYPGKTAGQYDLDVLCTGSLTETDKQHTQNILKIRAQAIKEGLSFLKEAKKYHDELESACHDAVDFESITEKTEQVIRLMKELLTVK